MKTLLYSFLQKQPYFFSSVLCVPPWHVFKLSGVVYLSIFFQDKPYGFPNVNSLQGEKQRKFLSVHMFGTNNNRGITWCYFLCCSVKGMCFSAVTQIMRFFPCVIVLKAWNWSTKRAQGEQEHCEQTAQSLTQCLSYLIARKSPCADGIAEYFDL